jgi:hypothetical protein
MGEGRWEEFVGEQMTSAEEWELVRRHERSRLALA